MLHYIPKTNKKHITLSKAEHMRTSCMVSRTPNENKIIIDNWECSLFLNSTRRLNCEISKQWNWEACLVFQSSSLFYVITLVNLPPTRYVTMLYKDDQIHGLPWHLVDVNISFLSHTLQWLQRVPKRGNNIHAHVVMDFHQMQEVVRVQWQA